MKILVIGGSYFFGRVYTMLAAEQNEVTVLNRGTYSMAEFGAECLLADRRSGEAAALLAGRKFDAVVDFCAYRQGDVERIFTSLSEPPEQYILISTADVYRKWTGLPLTEESPLEERRFGGETGEYIWQKILLEKELEACCAGRRTASTRIRPSVLYGPFNYAPRESEYVRLACAGQEIVCPIGAPGRFQPVYVKDAAAMVLALTGRQAAFGRAYNLAGETVDYEAFLEAFSRASGGRMRLRRVPAREAVQDPAACLPFPLEAEETEYYDGSRAAAETGIAWTPLETGLEKVWNAFARLYAG